MWGSGDLRGAAPVTQLGVGSVEIGRGMLALPGRQALLEAGSLWEVKSLHFFAPTVTIWVRVPSGMGTVRVGIGVTTAGCVSGTWAVIHGIRCSD